MKKMESNKSVIVLSNFSFLVFLMIIPSIEKLGWHLCMRNNIYVMEFTILNKNNFTLRMSMMWCDVICYSTNYNICVHPFITAIKSCPLKK